MNTFAQIFGTHGELLWWQECARGTLIFGYGLLLVRLAGRRVFGKWSALDIIVSIIIGSNLSRAITGTAPLGGTLAASTLIVFLHWILSHAAARNAWLSALLEGIPSVLARGGIRRADALATHAISENDLTEALRQAGVEHISETRLVTLEPSGKISVLKPERHGGE